eukprot:131771-Amphidinium_carterae.1
MLKRIMCGRRGLVGSALSGCQASSCSSCTLSYCFTAEIRSKTLSTRRVLKPLAPDVETCQ